MDMKFSRTMRIAMATAVMMGLSAAANASFYNLGTTSLPVANGNASPGPTVTDGDQITLKGVWDGAGASASGSSTSWYFTTALPNLLLDNAVIVQNGFAGFSAVLYDPLNNPILTLTAGTIYNAFPLLLAGTYKLVVTANLVHGDGHSYTFDARIIPLPAAAWLLLSGVAGLGAMARRRKVAAEA
jgi:hypothetical protein